MSKGQPLHGVPFTPLVWRLGLKISLGLLCLIFFLNYQPTFGFPPIKKALVRAQAEQSQIVSAQVAQFQLPHPGYLSTHFSNYHPGIDIASGLGMPVKPIAQGEVVEAGFNFWGLGLVVEVEHEDGLRSLYAHLGKIYVKKGQTVKMTDTLGEVGLTGHTSGPHTHLEISKEGQKINPISILPTLRDYPLEEDFKAVGQAATPPAAAIVVIAQPALPQPSSTPKPTPNVVQDLLKDTSVSAATAPKISANLDLSLLKK